MNQTRTFLLLILAFIAYLLFTQWQKDYHHPQTVAAPAAVSTAPGPAASSAATAAIPTAAPSAAASAATPAPSAAPLPKAAPVAATHGTLITVTTDVLRLTIDSRGGTVLRAALLKYPESLHSKASIHLLDDRAKRLFVAQSGLVSADGAAPDQRALFHAARTSYTLAAGADSVSVPLTWTDPSGIEVTKTYTLHRGSYAVALSQKIHNGSAKAWSGNAYHQLQRVVPPQRHYSNFLERYSDQSRYGFTGAAWYSPADKLSELKFDKFHKDPLNRQVGNGWIAMLEHYFLGAWVPPAKEKDHFSSVVVEHPGAKPSYIIRAVGPQILVAPGQSAGSSAKLYLGPKLSDKLSAVTPSLHLAVDYGLLTPIIVPLHWFLATLHRVSGNWGVAIILLVLLINIAMYKLSAAQYASAAKMRKIKPRMDALKERYGDDKQKMQQAMMELYKKEKVNPAAGCLPLVVQMPVFFALFELLRKSVELRQAPFVGWIHDLSAADPYFVLPVLYMLVMLVQQFMMPVTPGMDPTQQKMMRFMPIAFSVMFAFFPAGLVLYYVVNGMWRLGQQWWVMRQFDRKQAART